MTPKGYLQYLLILALIAELLGVTAVIFAPPTFSGSYSGGGIAFLFLVTLFVIITILIAFYQTTKLKP